MHQSITEDLNLASFVPSLASVLDQLSNPLQTWKTCAASFIIFPIKNIFLRNLSFPVSGATSMVQFQDWNGDTSCFKSGIVVVLTLGFCSAFCQIETFSKIPILPEVWTVFSVKTSEKKHKKTLLYRFTIKKSRAMSYDPWLPSIINFFSASSAIRCPLNKIVIFLQEDFWKKSPRHCSIRSSTTGTNCQWFALAQASTQAVLRSTLSVVATRCRHNGQWKLRAKDQTSGFWFQFSLKRTARPWKVMVGRWIRGYISFREVVLGSMLLFPENKETSKVHFTGKIVLGDIERSWPCVGR